ASLARAVGGAATRAEVERAGLEAFFEFVRRHPALYRIIRQAEFVDRDVYREHYERLAEGYQRGLAEAMRRGEFRDLDPEVLAYCLMGMAELLGARWLLWDDASGGKARPPRKVLDTAIEFLLAGARRR
ncbi:MAG: TetR/AcrR family transcriptional regulator, partial [Actinomycetota bacterium]